MNEPPGPSYYSDDYFCPQVRRKRFIRGRNEPLLNKENNHWNFSTISGMFFFSQTIIYNRNTTSKFSGCKPEIIELTNLCENWNDKFNNGI